MMKKLLWLLAFCFTFLGIGATLAASNDCLNIDLGSRSNICVAMTKRGTTYDVSLQSYDLGVEPRSSTLLCEIETPDGSLHALGACDGSFTCSSNYCQWSKQVTIYARSDNSTSSREKATEYYDFSNGYWDFNSNGGGSSNNTYLNVSSNQTSPSINSYVNLTVETNSSYRGRVDFEMQYRSTNSSSWQTVNSSSYFSASSTFGNGYQFTSSDAGYRTFSSFVSFAKEGYYRLYARDNSGRENYVQFYVEGNSSNNTSYLNVSASTTSPSTSTYVDVTVETDSNYRGRVDFSLEYRSSSSYSWSTVSSSSSDISPDNYFRNGYQFTSSDSGYKRFYSLLRFNRAGDYRLTVKDGSGRERSVTFYVEGSSSNTNNNNSRITVTTNRSAPSVDQYVTVNVETNSDYRGWVDFEVQYRSSTSSSWSTVTSSTYFTADNYLKNGYQFTSSDRGYRSFSSFIRFNRSGYYRLYVKDNSNNQDYVQFDVDSSSSSSSVNGFSSSELRKITNVSNIWNNVINQLKNKSYTLRTDSYWQRLSDSLYTNMRDVVLGNYYRVFSNYSDFISAFEERYRYTVRNR